MRDTSGEPRKASGRFSRRVRNVGTRKMESIELRRIVLVVILCNFLLLNLGAARHHSNYYGKFIGNLNSYAHQVKGQVYAVDDSIIFIKGFSYDGIGPAAYFRVGGSDRPSPNGDMIPYPEDYIGQNPPFLKGYHNADIILRLPHGRRIRDIKWLSVWCERFAMAFGDVFIPRNLEVPKIRVLPKFSRFAHGLSSGNISILDSKTIYIPNLHYDGAAPDAYFWVGNGTEPNALGIKVPNEMGSLNKLRSYQGEDIELVLPGNLTIYDIDWLAVWCVHYKQNFGHVLIPKGFEVPPALGQTKITPAWWYSPTISAPVAPPPRLELTNCKEIMKGRVQVQWEAIGDDVQIRLSARVEDDNWVAFGLSGEEGKAKMLEGDVVVAAYLTKTNKFIAEDYYISAMIQCDGKMGVCPDERVGGRNDVILLSGQRKNGVTIVEYRRPMRTNEPVLDRMITEAKTSVIAAIGRLNSLGEANAHTEMDRTSEDIKIDFTSRNVQECTNSLWDLPDKSYASAWPPATIDEGNNFIVRIGPTVGDRGYSRITDQPALKIAWYVNDLLMPELVVERGQTYTFVVEGGNDQMNLERYHPFYITDNPEGGYGQKNEDEQMQQKVFAGVGYDSEGLPYPTAAGRYCEWVHKTVDMSSESETFQSFFQTLRLECDQGEPAKLVWTVAQDTPDLVYYQCYNHNNLGWKIHVVDEGFRPQRSDTSGTKNIIFQKTTFYITLTSSVIFQITFLR